MVVVSAPAVMLGLGLPAREVAGWKDYHTHGRVIECYALARSYSQR